MNELIIKRASILAFVFGAILGLASIFPLLIGYTLFVLTFLASVFVILIMKKDQKELGIINTQQGAILGAIIGFFSGVGYFLSFCPLVLIIHLMFKNYYSYGIPYILQDAFWLFIVILLSVCFVFAATNAASGMGLAYLISKFEVKPNESDGNLDIKIDD